jgi:hypothetical protein
MTRNRFARRGCRGRGDEIPGVLTGPGTARAGVERGGGYKNRGGIEWIARIRAYTV